MRRSGTAQLKQESFTQSSKLMAAQAAMTPKGSFIQMQKNKQNLSNN
jgi:hypothetical protein